jgi:hypothetical protein
MAESAAEVMTTESPAKKTILNRRDRWNHILVLWREKDSRDERDYRTLGRAGSGVESAS